MGERLFGTDGVRGTAGTYPMDRETATRLGAAVVRVGVEAAPDRAFRVLVGRDTRESGPWLEAALAGGVERAGGQVADAGVLPTPAVAYLTGVEDFQAGFVISASHNPFRDNGIKVFSADGRKLDDAREREVERLVLDRGSIVVPAGRGAPPEDRASGAPLLGAYLDHAAATLPDPDRIASLPVTLDCANGATYRVAPMIFERLGFDPEVLHASPDGRNINLGCGSTAPEGLARVVRKRGGIGVAFDGDGDRTVLVDERGRIVDGDAILLVCAVHRKRLGRLPGDAIVATVMSNIGLELALRRHGIDVVRCPVGDRFVSEALQARGLALGGEQSGHVILADRLWTGDGLMTALGVLHAMADAGRPLAELAGELDVYPQVLVNVPVREKRDLTEVGPLTTLLASVEQRLADQGRLVVRYSGTEPLLRVMIEGQDEAQIRAWADEIADVVGAHLG